MKFTAFQQLLYRKFVGIDHPHDVQQVAGKLGVAVSTFYKWTEGTLTFPVDFIPTLFLVTNDVEFLQFCLDGTGFTLSQLPGTGPDKAHLAAATLQVAATTGRLADVVQKAVQDGVVDRKERAAIREAVSALQRESQSVMLSLEEPIAGLLRAVK